MLQSYCVTFAGHRRIDCFTDVEKQLYQIIADIIRTKEYVEFYVGIEGDFDIMAASCIRRAKQKVCDDNNSLNLVLPYSKAGMEFMEASFDSIIIPPELHGVHPKKAIALRNRWMVDRSDALITYVLGNKGGANDTMKYAIDMKKAVIKIKTTE